MEQQPLLYFEAYKKGQDKGLSDGRFAGLLRGQKRGINVRKRNKYK